MAEENNLDQEVTPPESMESGESRGRKSTLGIPYRSGTKEYARAYYEKNKEKMNERMKQYHKDHPEKARAAVKKATASDPDRVKEAQKRYRETVKAEHAAIIASGSEEKPRFEDAFGGGSTSEDAQEDGNGKD